jgi:hypothetical protein
MSSKYDTLKDNDDDDEGDAVDNIESDLESSSSLRANLNNQPSSSSSSYQNTSSKSSSKCCNYYNITIIISFLIIMICGSIGYIDLKQNQNNDSNSIKQMVNIYYHFNFNVLLII